MSRLNKKSKLIIFLIIIVVLSTFVFTYFIDRDKDDFAPVMRFVVASDIHVDDSGSELEEERLDNLFKTSYKYASKNKKYNKVDAFLFVGDITNIGTLNSFNKFNNIINENIKSESKLMVSLGNHDFYSDPSNTVDNFRNVFNSYEDEHLLINGFHFIKISPSDGNHYNEEKQNWLDNELLKASLDTPSLPIFVMQHHHINGTVYGSTVWGVEELTHILNKYPQVVDFSGHSHFPIIDERNIHQDKFTSIGTGTLSYYELGLNGVASEFIFPTDYQGGYSKYKNNNTRDAAQFQIIEVNKSGDIRIIGYDLIFDNIIFKRYINNPATRTTSISEETETNSGVPIFLFHNKLNVLNIDVNSVSFVIPKPWTKVNVESYIVKVYKDDELVQKIHRLSGYVYFYNYETKCYIENLESNTNYTIKVYAVNVYNKISEPLEINIKTR